MLYFVLVGSIIHLCARWFKSFYIMPGDSSSDEGVIDASPVAEASVTTRDDEACAQYGGCNNTGRQKLYTNSNSINDKRGT